MVDLIAKTKNITKFRRFGNRANRPKSGILLALIVGLSVILVDGCNAFGDGVQENESARAAAVIKEQIRKADELFKERKDTEKLRESIKILKQARNPDKRDFDVEWKYAKYSYFLGQRISDENEKIDVFKAGEKAGLLASRIEPNRPEGHYWFGMNLGGQAEVSPLTVGIPKVDDISEAMERVIKIDPSYEDAGAFDALARVQLASGLIGGTAEKAAEFAEKGMKVNGDNPGLRLNLARAYLALDRDEEARTHLEFVVSMKAPEGFETEHEENLAEAKSLLSRNY